MNSKKFEKCKKCGKELKDDESQKRGYGPKCWESVEKITVKVIHMPNEKGLVGDGYEEGSSERICSNMVKKENAEVVLFYGAEIQEYFGNGEPDFTMLVYLRKDLIDTDWEISYPDGCNPMKLDHPTHVPVARYSHSVWEGCGTDYPTLKGVVDRLTKTSVMLVGNDYSSVSLEGIEIDFDNTLYDIETDWPDTNRFIEGFETKLWGWGEDSVYEMAYEDAHQLQRWMMGQQYHYEERELPDSLPIERDYWPNSADELICWHKIVTESFQGEDSMYGSLCPLMKAVMDRVFDDLSSIIAEHQVELWGLDYLKGMFEDWQYELTEYHLKTAILDNIKEWLS
jgi:hypothetical protein